MHRHTAHEIDGYQVEFERDEGWRCKCGHFERANICEHTTLCAAISTIERRFFEAEALGRST